MDLPVAPPAFDATTGPRRRRRAELAADVGAGCGLVFLELVALVAIFGLWFLSGFNLDPAENVTADPLWGYLAAAGGVGVLAVVAAVVAVRSGAVVTASTQVAMATLICVIGGGGAAVQAYEDEQCRHRPEAASCQGDG
ncbi:DUF6234 family protein [Streptomyces sp. JJ38]|uniref:DUF6234 family protein n=1 Tax=Streptomyces sp. JJ38 TaxID=2738128 RepID=UPI001C572622|nr:DUF6234 family protein [Streptomyces sp. JJ38]MBW1596630.1 hypothetical protein [Streptomyces sp. JJ38]